MLTIWQRMGQTSRCHAAHAMLYSNAFASAWMSTEATPEVSTERQPSASVPTPAPSNNKSKYPWVLYVRNANAYSTERDVRAMFAPANPDYIQFDYDTQGTMQGVWVMFGSMRKRQEARDNCREFLGAHKIRLQAAHPRDHAAAVETIQQTTACPKPGGRVILLQDLPRRTVFTDVHRLFRAYALDRSPIKYLDPIPGGRTVNVVVRFATANDGIAVASGVADDDDAVASSAAVWERRIESDAGALFLGRTQACMQLCSIHQGDHMLYQENNAAAMLLQAISTKSHPSPSSSNMQDLRVLGKHAAPPAWHRLQASIATSVKRQHPLTTTTKHLRRLGHTVTRRTPVPTVPHLHPRCCLTPSTSTTRFRKHALNTFCARAFLRIPGLVAAAGLPPVHLSPHDLFHAHLFLTTTTAQLGLLFHAKEYPAYCQTQFPYDLGFCQQKSTVTANQEALDWRNILWFSNTLVALNVGQDSAMHPLVMPGVAPFRTVGEDVFGTPIGDVFWINGQLLVEDFGAGRRWR